MGPWAGAAGDGNGWCRGRSSRGRGDPMTVGGGGRGPGPNQCGCFGRGHWPLAPTGRDGAGDGLGQDGLAIDLAVRRRGWPLV